MKGEPMKGESMVAAAITASLWNSSSSLSVVILITKCSPPLWERCVEVLTIDTVTGLSFLIGFSYCGTYKVPVLVPQLRFSINNDIFWTRLFG